MDDVFKDERFAHIASDPRFKKLPKAQRKVKIDKRFQSIFNGKQFKVTYTVDKRGKPVRQSSSDNFRKYYDLSSDDDSEEDVEEESTDQVNEGKTLKSKSKKEVLRSEASDDVSSASDDGSDDENETCAVKSGGSDSDSDDDKKKGDSFKSSKQREELSDDIREKLRDSKVDYARGMGALLTDSSSDDASSDETDEDNESVIEHDWGELDKDADVTDSSSCRLAICNMDWDRIRAEDLMVLCSSFLPSGGHILSVTIYPSEYGQKRMREEEISGPTELVQKKTEGDDENEEETKEGSKFHMERLRKYQLNRLKYYYAVVVCDSVGTASKIYSECDGLEYESSSTRLDLRFIPDDVGFDQEPKDVCTEVQEANKYQPRFFVNTALQQGKVSCTWDETDPNREQLAAKLHQSKGNSDNINEADLQMFLASSSGEEDETNEEQTNNTNSQEDDDLSSDDSDGDDKECGTSKSIVKYRNLLNKIQEDEEKKKNRDVEMEITWGVGLKDKAKSLVEKKMKENDMTPFEMMIEKKKEKRKQKREEKLKKKADNTADSGKESDENENAAFSDDELPDDIDLNDDYFKEEFTDSDMKKMKKKKDKTKKKWKDEDELDSEEERKKKELELLLIDDEDEKTGKQHFNLKKIQANEDSLIKKKKKGRKQIKKKKQEVIVEDDFQVDLKDDRFNAVFTMPEYNIDPSDSHFRKTKGMDAFIQEKISRKYQQETGDDDEEQKPSKKRKHDKDLSSVVASIKKKTKSLK